MSLKKHLLVGAVVIIALFVVLWRIVGFNMDAFIVSTLLAQIIATDSILFVLRYRQVNWRATPWGRHVMRFCFILAVTFQAVVIVNLLVVSGHRAGHIVATITVLLYGAIAAEMHNRRYLEKRAQKEKMKW